MDTLVAIQQHFAKDVDQAPLRATDQVLKERHNSPNTCDIMYVTLRSLKIGVSRSIALVRSDPSLETTTVQQRRPRRGPPGPVSYTHLRAHETVLDLVCRLLL